jgi:hypothetical protein
MRSVTSQGSPYARFQRALANRNLMMVDAAARELPGFKLADAVRIVGLMASESDPRFDRAAARWLARLVREAPDVSLDELGAAIDALKALRSDSALETLLALGGAQP